MAQGKGRDTPHFPASSHCPVSSKPQTSSLSRFQFAPRVQSCPCAASASLTSEFSLLPFLPLPLFSSLVLLLTRQDSSSSDQSSIVDPCASLLCANTHSCQVPDAEVAIPRGSTRGGIQRGGGGGVTGVLTILAHPGDPQDHRGPLLQAHTPLPPCLSLPTWLGISNSSPACTRGKRSSCSQASLCIRICLGTVQRPQKTEGREPLTEQVPLHCLLLSVIFSIPGESGKLPGTLSVDLSMSAFWGKPQERGRLLPSLPNFGGLCWGGHPLLTYQLLELL